MDDESLEHFADEVKEKCNLLQTKLKSLHIATCEYVGNTKSQVNDLWAEGGRNEARKFRPVTPANVKVLLRLIAKDVGRLRQRSVVRSRTHGLAILKTRSHGQRVILCYLKKWLGKGLHEAKG